MRRVEPLQVIWEGKMKVSRLGVSVFATLLFLGLTASSGWAQFTSGLEGRVLDPSGAVVPGASVTLTNVATGIVHNTKSNADGIYVFTALPAGNFNLTVEASGFSTATKTDISIGARETRTFDVVLKVGATTAQVSVTAQVSEVDTTSAGVSGTINQTKVHELPLVGRNMYSLVVLTPGVVGLPSGGGQAYAQATSDIFNAELGVNLNAAGQRAEANNFQVDSGVSNGSPRGGVTNLTPNADSIQEVKIQTNVFDAKYGRNSGAIVNVLTKSGTNNIHGTMSYFNTLTQLNARNVFQDQRPSFLRNEYAGSLGGPIRKDKDFWFVSTDILRSSVGLGYPVTYPTQQLVNFMQTNVPNNISTGVLTDFPTQFPPTRDFRSAGTILGSSCTGSTLISTPIGQMPCDFPVTGTGDFNTSIFRNGAQVNGRIDHAFNDFKDRLYGSFYRTTRQTVEFAAPSPYYPRFSPAEPEFTDYVSLNWTHSSGGSFVNQMIATYTRTFGDAPCDNCQVPAMGSNDGTALPGNGFIGVFIQNNYNWNDVATLISGRHTFEFGGEIGRHYDDEFFTDTTLRPTFQFANVLEFAADNPYQESNINFNPRTGAQGPQNNTDFATRSTGLALFVGDKIKVTPNLTLNLGVRWEAYLGATEKYARQSNGSFVNGGSTYQERLAKMAMLPVDGLWHNRYDNFAPRIGLAWDPTGKGRMSIRAGYGISYDRITNQIYTSNRSNLPLIANATVSIFNPPPGNQPNFGLGASGETPYNFPQVSGLSPGLDAKNGLISGRAAQAIIDPNISVPYAESWNFGIQFELIRGWLAEGNYNGSAGHHLLSSYDVNRFTGDLFDNGVLDRYNSSFGALNYGMSNYNSAYHGGTLSLRNRGFWKGVNFQAAYTFGKAIDQAQTYGVQPVDPLALNIERGLADYDSRHRLSFSTLWRLPTVNSFLGSSKFANALINGWQVSNITILQAGSPFSVFCGRSFSAVTDPDTGAIIGNSGCDFNGDGINNDRPNQASFGNSLTGQQSFSHSDFLSGILTASEFPLPAFGQYYGSLGRNTFRGPAYYNTDFSAVKATHIPWFTSEGARMEIRAEFFNVFNHVNPQNPNGNLASGTFGQSTGVFPARNIQFGTRIQF